MMKLLICCFFPIISSAFQSTYCAQCNAFFALCAQKKKCMIFSSLHELEGFDHTCILHLKLGQVSQIERHMCFILFQSTHKKPPHTTLSRTWSATSMMTCAAGSRTNSTILIGRGLIPPPQRGRGLAGITPQVQVNGPISNRPVC